MLPKFIMYSGHAENLSPLLNVLKNPLGMMPPPASSVLFKFYKCAECKGDEKHQIQPVFAPYPDDEAAEFPLIFSKSQQKNGLMTTVAFEAFLQEQLDFVVKDSGAASTDIEAICQTKYEQHF